MVRGNWHIQFLLSQKEEIFVVLQLSHCPTLLKFTNSTQTLILSLQACLHHTKTWPVSTLHDTGGMCY